jgi:addiction module HigA family antidote
MPMKNPNHPGDIIRDCLDELGVNVTGAAKALGVTRAALSRVINRKAGVSVEMAVRLEKTIGSTAAFWLRLQLNYDLAQIQMRSGKIHARRLSAHPLVHAPADQVRTLRPTATSATPRTPGISPLVKSR